jgi:MFS family permease
VLYTISNLIIADALPKSKQSLAGGVFNTVSQIGNSVGLAIAAVISSSVSAAAAPTEQDENSLMKGYQAVYYVCIATFSIVAIVSGFGLRKAGRVGMKLE